MRDRSRARGASVVFALLLGVWFIGCESSSSGSGDSMQGPEVLVLDSTQHYAIGYEVILTADSKRGPGQRIADRYKWTLVEKPAGSAVDTAVNWPIHAHKLEFTPDRSGEYTVRVVGSVGDHRSEPVEYTVTILPWSGGLQLSAEGARQVGDYDLAMDANGNAVAIWQQEDQEADQTSEHRVYSACYDGNSGSWSWENCLDDAAGFDDYERSGSGPKVALNAAGEGLAAWIRHTGTQLELWGSPYEGGNWRIAKKIASSDEMHEERSRWQVMADPGGEKLVWWQPSEASSDSGGPMVRWSDAGWSDTHELGRRPLATAPLQVEGEDRLAVAIYSAGALAIRYYDPSGPDWQELNSSLFSFSGTPDSQPLMKSGLNGGAWLAWQHEEADGNTSFYASDYNGSHWSEPALLGKDGNYSNVRHLTHTDMGEPIFWRLVPGEEGYYIWWSRYLDGSWSEPQLQKSPFGYDFVPITQPDGGWILVGRGDTSDEWQIGAWHYSPDEGWESAVRPVESEHPGAFGGEIKVVSDSDGNAVIIWRQYHDVSSSTANPSGLYSARYDADSDRWITTQE